MKKNLRIFLTVLLMAAAFTSIPHTSVNAASKDVTTQMAADRNIKKISKMVTAYTTAMNLSAYSTTEQVTLKLNNADRLALAAFVRYNYKNDYNYSVSELRSETKALFGKSVSAKAISKYASGKKGAFICSSPSGSRAAYTYSGGDFGDMIPVYRIKKIVKTGKKTYTVTLQNQLRYYGEKGKVSIGTTTLKLKKSSSSVYGYVVKGISYQYNGKY